MRRIKLFSWLGAMALAASPFLLPVTANAGNWSVNIGIPVVVAAPPPAVVYSAPVVPVAAVAAPVPVIYPHVSTFVVTKHPARHHFRSEYRGRPAYRHGRR